MLKNKLTTPALALGVLLLGGAMAGATAIASAQTATTSGSQSITTNAPTPPSGAPRVQGHMPLGHDGIVASVNGSTIVMNEEADEGGAAYTVDASHATVQVKGTTGSLSDIKVGEKLFVDGTVNGTSVTATSVSVGHPNGRGSGGFGGPRPNDNDADDGATRTTQSSTSGN